MQILGNIFNAIIFVSAIGGIFCVLSLFINHILRCTLPLWFPLCGMILFLRSIPFTGCISHITRNTGMVKWILYCLLDMGVWVWYSFRL